MRKFGLIGYPLGHSFSKKYFTEKFEKEQIPDCSFDLFEIPQIADFTKVLDANPELEGMSVTIPYKQEVIPWMDALDPACEKIGAVNCIKIEPGKLTGYNTDYFGFKGSLENWLGPKRLKALVLGTGGASKAIKQALKDLEIEFLSVSRNPADQQISYQDLEDSPSYMADHHLLINCTPLGTFPKTEGFPPIPLSHLTSEHWVFDLVYNPSETTLMKACLSKGGKAKNGLEMLELQAEAAWKIWNTQS
ncbi:shikimate dehydrogenase family protein [Algoriphagus algorifonticola]|uniref:shikimate dehydrogenase family protein n=1 Tax=Algoriphagus algorifonticola TaxID=2593007 RepID=UPI0011A1B699|nr:shikimate dehydrogenase [Algoriphagus algorifonticola]